jgi:AbrB family looped-hinge helix DNA binding protein
MLTEYNRRSAMAVVTVSQKGWVVIPVELRNKYQWNTGDRIKVVDYGGVVSLVPVLRNPEEEGFGALSMRGRSLLKGLKHTRNDERRREKTRR